MLYEGALASFLNSALGFSPTLFLQFSEIEHSLYEIYFP